MESVYNNVGLLCTVAAWTEGEGGGDSPSFWNALWHIVCTPKLPHWVLVPFQFLEPQKAPVNLIKFIVSSDIYIGIAEPLPSLYKNLNMHLIVYTTKKLGQDTWPHHVNWEILHFTPLYWFCPIHWRKPIYHSRCLGDDANNLSEPPEHHSTQGVQVLTPGHTNCAAYFRWFMTALLNPFTPEEVIWRHSFRERRPEKGFCCANTLITRDLSPITLL